MLRPSYSELMEVINNDPDLDSEITSRYTIVIAAAKRARQITDGAPHSAVTGMSSDKAVSIAVKEIADGVIKITPQTNAEEKMMTAAEMADLTTMRVVSLDDAETSGSFHPFSEDRFE